MPVTPPRARVRPFRAEREFGLLVGAVLVAIAAWWLYRDKFPEVRAWFFGAGGVLVALGALVPRALVVPFRVWMALAELLARVMTTLILGVVFFLVVTPIGVVKRLSGWDPLERRLAAAGGAGTSFWRPYSGRQHDPKHFDRMF
jgi:hypothetical protein